MRFDFTIHADNSCELRDAIAAIHNAFQDIGDAFLENPPEAPAQAFQLDGVD